MHIFSSTCKAESVLDLFHDKAEREKAIKWFKDHSITKVYIESFRHGRLVSEERLRLVRDDFAKAGLEVAGCITPTQMSERESTYPIGTCFTEDKGQDFLQMVVERTARVFDLIILDDFFFTSCCCEFCEQAKGDKGVGEFRSDLMLEIANERVLEAARKVNENVKIIIKYPLWYEGFVNRGYDVIRETDLFDITWIGTETRDPDSPEAGRRPQTSASWIQRWMNDVSNGKCGGGWYDPIDTSPNTYVEQARQTIIGGAKESLLHCYDYLGTKTPGVAIHGKDLEIKNGLADAEAFKNECKGLRLMADKLETMEAYGVLVPKKPNVDYQDHVEAYLPSFIGMLGIPTVASASLKTVEAAVLTVHSSEYEEIETYIESFVEGKKPLLITEGLKGTLKDECGHCVSTLPYTTDHWELMDMEQQELDEMRNNLLKPFDIELFAPSRVSLHLFSGKCGNCEIIENFNDFPVTVQVSFLLENAGERTIELTLPTDNSAAITQVSMNSCQIEIEPRALVMIATEMRIKSDQ